MISLFIFLYKVMSSQGGGQGQMVMMSGGNMVRMQGGVQNQQFMR